MVKIRSEALIDDDDTNGHTRKERGLVGFCFQTYTVGCVGSGGL